MSFGFGVGDILGASTLAFRICQAFSDSSSADFHLLVTELEYTGRTLTCLARILEKSSFQSALELEANDVVKDSFKSCQTTLDALAAIVIGKYQAKFMCTALRGNVLRRGVDTLRAGWARVTWAMRDRAEVDALREKLKGPIAVLALVLGVCQQ